MSLRDKAVKGVKWTTVSSMFGAGAQLLQLAVLTRYLAPEDFGLMALAIVVIGFSQMFLDMGISNAIIHQQDISKKELDTLYILNIFSGIGVFLILYMLAPTVAQFYNEPKLGEVIRWISISFIIQPIGQQFLVLLRKELRFNEIAKRDILTKLVSLVTAILLAVNNFGVYSLVFANIIGAIISTILLIYIGLQYHRPSIYLNLSLVKHSLRFGMFQMGENFINYFNTQFDSIMIGKLLGIEALGIYDIAKNLAMRPAQIINPILTQITFPLMAKLQHNLVEVKSAYLKTIHYLTSVNFPIYFFIAVFSEPLVVLLFGEQWTEAVPILRILAGYGMIRSTANPVGALLLSKGRADWGFYWNFALFFLIPISLYIGSFYGLVGTALTLLLLQLILMIPVWYFLINKCSNAGFGEYFKQMLKPFLFSSVQVICYLYITWSINNYFYQLSFGIAILTLTSILLNKYFNKEFYTLILSVFMTFKKTA